MRHWVIDTVLLLVVESLVLWRIIKVLPGNGTQVPNRHSKHPWNAATLREDCGDGLPDGVYEVFQQAYESQYKGDYEWAAHLYTTICQQLVGEECYELFLESPTFEHNWNLLSQNSDLT